MKYIISFLIVVLGFSFFMAIARDYTLYKQMEIGIAHKVEPPAPPVQNSMQHQSLPPPASPPTAPTLPPPASPPSEPLSPAVNETPEYEEPDEYEEDEEEYAKPESYYNSYSSTQNEIAREIMKVFGHEWKIAMAVATAESSLNPQAVNQNRNGTRDIGIFQINDHHGWSAEERYNWRNNIAMAKEIRDRYGWSAWSVYKSGQFKQFM